MPLGVSRPMDVESGTSQVWDPTLAESDSSDAGDTEVIVEKVEQPGLDSLRGTFGAIGTIIRNRRRTALAEAYDRDNNFNRRGSEASGLASQSINEEPREPGEERDVEKLHLGHRYFGSGTRRPSEPTPNNPPHDPPPQGTQSTLFPPSGFSTEQPVMHSSPDSEKSDPLSTFPKRTPGLHAHFDPNQQPPSSRIRTLSHPPLSDDTTSRADQPNQDTLADREKSPPA